MIGYAVKVTAWRAVQAQVCVRVDASEMVVRR